ncbi:tripartite tricarboxylate transporter substrate binding protein [Vineibacter terrae]|uniref:Bug family tripartite tricarboxylate transporter substrate binding protein n=1 Tax=Vineibacter terrae TaxID=2586908 RepID=UPI002E32C136|nr:tripartite tricarboxylate transporter substrate binding protein [Vineibacter terrae]HEX2890808.1 tripartite tricarboxylate transporter substrate binding protein [Vineibacter terrae]
MNRMVAAVAGLAFGLIAGAAAAQDYPWKPDRPITIIVPWAAGGSTDQMTRIVAAELEAELKQKFVVVNQPGASGSIGTKNALEAAKDGYTWAAGAAVDVGTYRVLGLLDTDLKDWRAFFAVANVSAIAANPAAGFKDFGDFLEKLKRDGDNIPVATAGLSSAGHNMMESIRAATPIKYKHVTYNGGAPAVVSTVAGETKAVSQLLVEMSEHIKGKRLVPLVVMAEKPVMLEGYGEIAPTVKWLPKMPAPMNYFGIWVHKDAPPAVIQTMEAVWKNKIAKSEAVQKYANARSAIFAPLFGDEAQAEAFKMIRYTAWLYFDAGKAKVSPDTLGIQRLQ